MAETKRNTVISSQKLTLPDGLQVGILNLDAIMKEVAALELRDKHSLKTELLARVKTCNYIAIGAEKDYESALLSEYQKRFSPGEKSSGIDPKKPHAN